ncbi:hypothetical protein [Ensifer sp. SL37]|uniref:hypothetical protein n=1 Tax=Ensifer sp. SL37 TaxID=2995137 RepID=UPI002276401F|nr:hypothetical protein [Ensifer sp. SL37]MCY1745062.1 hypothetical protein [Ensifer sp. SL37]
MSSKDPDLDIDAEDISLLVEILKAAGYLEAKERDERAEKFLTAAIQRGELTKAQLTAFLGKRGAPGGKNQTAAQTKTEAINRWENEGGAIARSPFELPPSPVRRAPASFIGGVSAHTAQTRNSTSWSPRSCLDTKSLLNGLRQNSHSTFQQARRPPSKLHR